jgi:hypothetical protein
MTLYGAFICLTNLPSVLNELSEALTRLGAAERTVNELFFLVSVSAGMREPGEELKGFFMGVEVLGVLPSTAKPGVLFGTVMKPVEGAALPKVCCNPSDPLEVLMISHVPFYAELSRAAHPDAVPGVHGTP